MSKQQFVEYKGWSIPEPCEDGGEEKKTPPKPLPHDVKLLFDRLNNVGLSHPRDPLCVDMNYTKNRNRWSVAPYTETRLVATPQEIQTAHTLWFLQDWKNRSLISKLFSILWHLPAHLYRKYLATVEYRFYYNGFVSFVQRLTQKQTENSQN
ncbi:hypothetical protein EBU91_03400 [bacterium]|nr:hypothetical protein [bacterium]